MVSAGIQALNRLFGLFLGIILARTLGPEGYGVYAYAMALLTLLTVVGGVGMPSLMLREVAASQARNEWGYLKGLLIRGNQIVFLVTSVIAIVGNLVIWLLEPDGFPSGQQQTLVLMLLILPIFTLNKNITSALRGFDFVSMGLFCEVLLQPILAVIGIATIFYFWPDLRRPEFAMCAQAFAILFVFIFAASVLKKKGSTHMRNVVACYQNKKWFNSAVPFTLIGGAAIINNQADILMLGWLQTAEEVGIYRIAMQGGMLVAFGLIAVDAVVAPHFARLYAQSDFLRLQRLITISARITLIMALPIVAVFVLVGGDIAELVFGEGFAQSHAALAILALGQLVNSAMGSVGYLFNMTGYEKESAQVLLGTALINIVLNGILIPKYGAIGAAIASATSLVVWKGTLAYLVKKRLGLNSIAFG